MSFHQIEEWFEVLRQFGYVPGFVLLYLRAIVPVFPLALYILINIHTYGTIVGILISWLGLISGTFTVYLICKKLVNTDRMQRIKQRTSVQRLISFIDRQGLIPLFILLCFPFTPNTVINFVASLSHIKAKYYFIVLVISKLISTIILGLLGKEVTTIVSHPLRGILMLVGLVIFWFVGRKIEQHFMGSRKE
ncbi:TVP38/TMEM64 family protein [Staphylococcus simiae]|uniref:TVP38/TMEM64 family membrane protein n=1 Tax=Staphylococcus simiae CCM 7213 = CCUG 51256 TaxID=911238 RepID=G5JMC2_9STAP|nr:TVP38/TMEM64 family protein [Staphylococcus simiae]EHJ06681.1 hypothetical protein SS7213T_13247 [Staphylococcus simiae CCM 7213 = CCUG 51256]PNZ10343.1 TVP38/TMEM64 family protein [Staphylococcus simiae]SNV66133.1 SNARE associated Golgi family protein [Staphylococcus simiae]